MGQGRLAALVTDIDETNIVGNGFPGTGLEVDLTVVAGNRKLLHDLGRQQEVRVSAITNKPAAQLSQVVHMMYPRAVAGFTHYAEAGAVEIPPGCYVPRVNGDFKAANEQWIGHDRPMLVHALRAHGFDTFEPGKAEGVIITVVNEGHGMDNATFYERVHGALPTRNGSALQYRVVAGGGGRMVDIMPMGLDKAHGAHVFLRRHGDEIDPARSVWVGDTESDIPAARVFAAAGFWIVAVGNADAKYRAFVASCSRGKLMDSRHAAEHSFRDVLVWYASQGLRVRSSHVDGGLGEQART